jgi:hypothetical protein
MIRAKERGARVRAAAHGLGLLLALGVAALAGAVAGPSWSGEAGVGRAGAQGRPGGGAHGASTARGGRSVLVYPLQRIALRMDHSHPEHRALPCVRCHTQAPTSRRASDLLVPREETCNPCHAAQTDRSAEGPATCGACHVGYGEAGPRVVPESAFPRPRLHFSHAAHTAEPCASCHEGVTESRLGTRDHLPTMRSCLRCHGGARPTAPSACTTCHLAEPDGVLRTRFPEGAMNPPSWLGGMRHDADFLLRHRWIAADQGSTCASCHRESDCADCHDGRVRPRGVHPGDYLTTHAQEARRDQTRCTTCHSVQRTCLECHARLGLSPQSAPAVRASERYHPPPAVWGRAHGLEARRALGACVSCHAERDCVSCHGGLGVGGGRSPHPPGFAAECGARLAQNARACVTCHGDVGALAARCR